MNNYKVLKSKIDVFFLFFFTVLLIPNVIVWVSFQYDINIFASGFISALIFAIIVEMWNKD